MIRDLSDTEIDLVNGGELEGAAASAALLSAGFAALAAVPTPASIPLGAAAAITGVLSIGIGYFGTAYGGGNNDEKLK